MSYFNGAYEEDIEALHSFQDSLPSDDSDEGRALVALQGAAVRGSEEDVKRAIETFDANVDGVGRNGMTALHWAAKRRHGKVVSLLLKYKAKIDIRDDLGFSPLSHAAIAGHDDIVMLLLSAGADVNVSDEFGNTPLLRAVASRGLETTAELLLKNGANAFVRNKSGEGYMQAAMKSSRRKKEKIALLRTYLKERVEAVLECMEMGKGSISMLKGSKSAHFLLFRLIEPCYSLGRVKFTK
mmetsp:Transcript_17395/g.43337  ORF Transcript_17395/g.43337 Transcript_17395/m.43337 type:complete len:240 (-) Transcript_17395:12-731(-)